MQYNKPEGPLVEEILKVLKPRGYHLVSFSSEIIRKGRHVHCVLHHENGVELDALAEIHRELQIRLEELLEHEDPGRDVRMEFSSPGLFRTFAGFHEFEIFCGRNVHVLPVDNPEWIHGTIGAADKERCLIRLSDGSERRFHREDLVKAKLAD